MVEKQASSEIAASRERFEKFFKTRALVPPEWNDEGREYANPITEEMWLSWEHAERDTRERCAQIVENEPLGYITESEHEKLEHFADRVAERIGGKD